MLDRNLGVLNRLWVSLGVFLLFIVFFSSYALKSVDISVKDTQQESVSQKSIKKLTLEEFNKKVEEEHKIYSELFLKEEPLIYEELMSTQIDVLFGTEELFSNKKNLKHLRDYGKEMPKIIVAMSNGDSGEPLWKGYSLSNLSLKPKLVETTEKKPFSNLDTYFLKKGRLASYSKFTGNEILYSIIQYSYNLKLKKDLDYTLPKNTVLNNLYTTERFNEFLFVTLGFLLLSAFVFILIKIIIPRFRLRIFEHKFEKEFPKLAILKEVLLKMDKETKKTISLYTGLDIAYLNKLCESISTKIKLQNTVSSELNIFLNQYLTALSPKEYSNFILSLTKINLLLEETTLENLLENYCKELSEATMPLKDLKKYKRLKQEYDMNIRGYDREDSSKRRIEAILEIENRETDDLVKKFFKDNNIPEHMIPIF